MAKKRPGQIINPLVGFGQRAIGPYANRIGQSTYARNVNVGELSLPADFQAFGTVGNVIKALVKGEGAVTFERQTEAEVIDFEKISKTALVNEIRFENGRRVENFNKEEANAYGVGTGTETVIGGSGSSTIFDCSCGLGSGNRVQIDTRPTSGVGAGWDVVVTFEIKGKNGSEGQSLTIRSFDQGSNALEIKAITLPSEYTRYKLSGTTVVSGYIQLWFYDEAARDFEVKNIQLEEVTGQSNQNPSEYVSVGVATGSELRDLYNGFLADDPPESVWIEPAIEGAFVSTTSARQLNGYWAETLVLDKTYVITYEVYDFVAGVININYASSVSAFSGTGVNRTANGIYTEVAVCDDISVSARGIVFRGNTGTTAKFRLLSLKEADHGAFVDGVRYYARTNPNEVDGNNVVTQTAATTPLNDYRALFEPGATSYIAEPEDFTAGANWTGTGNLDGSESSTDSSLQGRKLWKLAATLGSTGTHTYVSSTHTKDAAVETWIGSIICRPDDPEVSWIALTVENGAGGEFGQQFFQLSDGSKGTFNSVTWTVDDAGAEQLANGDYRYWIKVTTNTTTNIRLRVSAANADNGDFFNLPQDKGFFVQGANLVEEGELSSYIGGTGLSSYSRTADNGSPMFDYANWSQDAGTWYVDSWFSDVTPPVVSTVLAVRNGAQSVIYQTNNSSRTNDGGGAITVGGMGSLRNTQIRQCTDFGVGEDITHGWRNVEASGTWNSGSQAYDGSFITNNVINIMYSQGVPVRLRRLTGYKTQKGWQWVEDTI